MGWNSWWCELTSKITQLITVCHVAHWYSLQNSYCIAILSSCAAYDTATEPLISVAESWLMLQIIKDTLINSDWKFSLSAYYYFQASHRTESDVLFFSISWIFVQRLQHQVPFCFGVDSVSLMCIFSHAIKSAISCTLISMKRSFHKI